MEERKKAEETAAAPTATSVGQQGTTTSNTRQPEQHQGSKRQGHPVTLKEFLLDDVTIGIKRAKGQSGP
eukprot:5281082-Pyramimonas_sp.AAC.1